MSWAPKHSLEGRAEEEGEEREREKRAAE